MAALVEVEGSGEGSISPAGAMGLMQLMPDKFRPGDDPYNPQTNLMRAAQLIRTLQDRWRAPDRVAGAYFGAIDGAGNVTGASDGNITGFEYVTRFRSAFKRYANDQFELPRWLASPLGDVTLGSEMIKFGFLGEYSQPLVFSSRGELGVLQQGVKHLSLDLEISTPSANPRAVPVTAPFAGRLARALESETGPFAILVENESLGLRARLSYLDRLTAGLDYGAQVKPGQQLGTLSARGAERFPHLHLSFERLPDSERLNPALFYRLKDQTDPATLAGQWYDQPPRMGPAPASEGQRARAFPEADWLLFGTRGPGRFIDRLGPFYLAAP